MPKLFLIAAPLLLAFTGCADSTSQRFNHAKPPQVFQFSDSGLSCDQLRAEVGNLDEALADASKGLGLTDDAATSLAMPTHVNPAMPMSVALGGLQSSLGMLASSMNAKNARDLQNAHQAYQQRRNVLMQQYFAKGC